MFNNFTIIHIPTLFVASALTFGGLMPFFNAEHALTEMGLPRRVAISKEAQSIVKLSSARSTAIGAAMLAFYFADKFAEVDTIMVITGVYVGAVDGYVCWKEGMLNHAIFRSASGAAIAAWGCFGMTAA